MEEALLPTSPFQPSPFVTAPSSPLIRETRPADDFPRSIYFSAPASPARKSSASFVIWEEGETPEDDFEFEFRGQLDLARQSASAEELFENGSWIRPPKRAPRVQNDSTVPDASTVSPRRQPVSSPAKFGFHPVEAAAGGINRRGGEEEEQEEEGQEAPLMRCYNRGRDRKAVPGGLVSRRETRSLPPLRLSDVIFGNGIEDESTEGMDGDNKSETRAAPYLARLMWVFGNAQGYGDRRWRLRDLLLFRSVSEGTGTRNLHSKEDTGSSSYGSSQRRWTARDSFRSNEDGVGSTSSRTNRARQSAVSRNNSVELHYTMNRAMSEEMKRKTFLPYRQGVLGCLGFGGGGGVNREFGSSTRGQL